MTDLTMPVRPDWADPLEADLQDDGVMIWWSPETTVGDFTVAAGVTTSNETAARQAGVFLDGVELTPDQARTLAAELVRHAAMAKG